MSNHNEITVFKGHYPSRECLAYASVSPKFMPGDSGMLVDIGGYQLLVTFEALQEMNKYANDLFSQYPGLEPEK